MKTVYPHSFKVEMVRRLTGPDAISAHQLSKQVRPCQPLLSRWLRQAREVGLENFCRIEPMTDDPSKLSAADKLQLVLQASALSDEELGGFMRQHGLHKEQLDQWKDAMLNGLAPKAPPRRQPLSTKADKKRIKRLERELARKDKALAETAALLVLQKKVQDLWGDEDESTPVSKGK